MTDDDDDRLADIDPVAERCLFCALHRCDECLWESRWCGHLCSWLTDRED